MTNRQAILPLAAAISLSASVSTAQTADGITQVSSLELNPLIVTSSRMTETADEALSAVSVIDREEIEQRQPQSTFDLLQTEPGVDVARNGGRGANNSVFLRGTESDHTLVLMDGMRVSSATTGQFAWRALPPASVERIEIVRGPRASLYGSDAIGGVVQVFSREPDEPYLRLRGGSNRTRQVEAGFGDDGPVRYGLNVGYEATDGFPSQEEGAGVQEDHGYRGRTVSGFASAPVAAETRLTGRVWANSSDVEFSTTNSQGEFETGEQDTRNLSSRVSLEQSLMAAWDHEIGVGYSEDQLENFGARSDDVHNLIRTRRSTVDWRHDVSVTESQTVQFGADFREANVLSEDRITGTEDFDKTLGNTGVYALWRGMFDGLDTEASVRHDDNRDFGSATTWQLAGGIPVEQGVRLRASLGTAFKAPSANELYSPGFFGGLYAGNPDLEPEESRSGELGVRFRDQGGSERAEVNLFVTRIDDLIAYQGQDFQAVNVDEAEIQGLEFIYGRSLQDWHLDFSATFQKAENRTTEERLARRPDEKASLVLGHDLDNRTRLSVEAKVAGERPDGSTTLAGYGVVNLAATRQLREGLKLEARVENLTNSDYQLANTYNTRDLSAFVGIRWEPWQ